MPCLAIECTVQSGPSIGLIHCVRSYALSRSSIARVMCHVRKTLMAPMAGTVGLPQGRMCSQLYRKKKEKKEHIQYKPAKHTQLPKHNSH